MERIAIIDITSKCNLRCTHCYNQERYWETKWPERRFGCKYSN